MPFFKVRNAYPCDYERLLQFMSDTYFRSEPSIVNIGLAAGPPDPTLLRMMHSSLHEGMSLLVEDKDKDCIVGAAVNVDLRREDIDKNLKLADSCECGRTRDLIRFYSFCSKQSDVWGAYCVDSVFECAHVAVHPEYHGKGIAKRLVQESWVLARDLAYRVFRIDASSRLARGLALFDFVILDDGGS